MQPVRLQAWYFRGCIAKRQLVCRAICLRGVGHLSLGQHADMGIDLPARLFAAWACGVLTDSPPSWLTVWTKLQTNQPLTAHR